MSVKVVVQPAAPATATLTFNYLIGSSTGLNGQFYFTLSDALAADFTIYQSVNVYDDYFCTNFAGTVGTNNGYPYIIFSGATGQFIVPADSVNSCYAAYDPAGFTVINGTSVYDGNTINIGGTVVTVVVISGGCTPTLCND